VTVKDRSVTTITLTPDTIPAGKRIGAVFYSYQGVDEYYAIPLEQGSAGAGGAVTTDFLGPQPAQNLTVLITAIFSGSMEVAAYLVDENADTPTLDVILANTDTSLWLSGATAISLTTDTEVFLATSEKIADTPALNRAITFDGSVIRSGEIPVPASPTGGTFAVSERIILTDKSAFNLGITPTVNNIPNPAGLPSGMRIGALFFKFVDADSHFAIPINSKDSVDIAKAALTQRSAAFDALGNPPAAASDHLKNAYGYAASLAYAAQTRVDNKGAFVLLRGPFPQIIGDTLISDQFESSVTIRAFLVPENAATPDLSGDFDGMDDPARWMTPDQETTTQTFLVGTGAFNVMLAWNTGTTTSGEGNRVDIDLWVWEPNGHKIYFDDKIAQEGKGQLDYDNTAGFGPENIYYDADSAVPVGSYQVELDYFNFISGSETTEYTVVMNACSNVSVKSGVFNTEQPASGMCSAYQNPLENNCIPLEAFSSEHYIAALEVTASCPTLQPIALPKPPRKPNIFEQAAVCDLPSKD
jgi:hypothetical protein